MRFLTKLLVTSLLLILAGSILFLVAFAGSGLRFPTSFTTKDCLYVEEAGNEIHKIELDLTNEDVRIEYGDVFSVKYLDVYLKNDSIYRAIILENDAGVLKIAPKQRKLRLFSFNYPDVNVTITIPYERQCDLALESTNGDFDILGKEGEKFKNCSIKVVNSEIKFKNVIADDLNLKTNNGDIKFLGVTKANSITLKTGNGEIVLENGNIYTDTLRINTNNGEIEFGDGTVHSNDIALETNNGDIEINLSGKRGDYSVTLETTNGDHNIVSGGNGAKRLSIETTNGDIEVGFTEE